MAKNSESSTTGAATIQPSPLSARPEELLYNIRKLKDPLEAASARRMERETEDINESADAFIRRFRQQLYLQRLESIENYRQMLARGV